MLIEQTLLGVVNKIDNAVKRCIEFQNKDKERITLLAFSGGKDSVAAYLIAVESGIKFKPVYSPTSVDPPEVINFIRYEFNIWAKEKGYPEVEILKYKKFSKRRGRGNLEGKEITMWTLLRNRALPPTRRMRYCCDELKERTGDIGDTVFTGVRWEESNSRRQQSMVNFYKGKIIVRIIVDFTTEEVWELIKLKNAPYCKKYDEGWERLGCIGCPLSTNQVKELESYPKYKENYIRAFDGMIEYRKANGMETEWKTGLDIYNWWIGEVKKENVLEGQCSMF